MADKVTTQQAGGGEGAPVLPPVSAQEEKPVVSVKTEQSVVEKVEIVPEPVPEVKPEETPAAVEPVAVSVPEVKPADNQPAPSPTVVAPATEVKVEVKPEGESNTAVESKDKAEVKTEVQSEAPIKTEVKTEVNNEPKVEEAPAKEEIKVANLPVQQDTNKNGVAGDASDWQQRELALLKKIQELEEVKKERSEDALKTELKVREEEIDLLKARVKNLETELQAALSKPGAKNHEMIENIKQQHEELLSKARGMIFDKTKMVKNQELQIEALTTQVQSLKDINLITKDLLEIRNSEIKAMEDRLEAMETRFKTEKERFGLVLERAQTSSNINDDLKQEYMTQLKIFKELRTKYEQKVQALVAENQKLKLDLAKTSGGPSTEPPK